MAATRVDKGWGTIALYGAALAGLVLLLKYFEYRYRIRDLRVEVYVGLVAVLFTALGVWMGSKLLQRRRQAAQATPHERNEEALARTGLSARELEVLELLAAGHTNAQIGKKLHVSVNTVKFHLQNIYQTLNVSNRTEATRWYLERPSP